MANPLKILTNLVISGSTNTSGSLTVGGNGGLTVANGLTITAGSVSLPATSVANAALQGSGQVTIGSTAIALGATEISLAGLITVETTDLQVSNIKANDGTAAATIADSTGIVTITSLTASTVDINGGAIDGTSIGTTTQSSGKFTTISGSSTLEIGGASTLAGGVTVTGAALNASAVEVSASALNVAGAASVGGNLTVTGDLQIQGSLNAVNRTDLYVTDAVILVASGSANAAAANGAGLAVSIAGVDDPSFTWDQTGKWVSTENLDLASGKTFKINGTDVLSGNTLGSGITNSSLTSVGTITSLTASALNVTGEVKLDGSSITLGGGSGDVVTVTGQLTASQGINLAAGKTVKIADVDALKVVETQTTLTGIGQTPSITGSALVSGSSNSLVGVFESQLGGGIELVVVSGSDGLVLEGGTAAGIEIRSVGSGGGLLINADTVEIITGSGGNFSSLPAGNTAGTINLTGSLDYILTNLGGGNSVTSTQYYGARVAATGSKASSADIEFRLSTDGTFDDVGAPGTNVYNIPKVNGLSSSTAGNTGFQELMDRMSYASLDVAVKESGSLTNWTNDLVSVTVSGTYDGGASAWFPLITISAPALAADASTKVRLIVVNEVSGALAL